MTCTRCSCGCGWPADSAAGTSPRSTGGPSARPRRSSASPPCSGAKAPRELLIAECPGDLEGKLPRLVAEQRVRVMRQLGDPLGVRLMRDDAGAVGEPCQDAHTHAEPNRDRH